jgi:tetratricopeptide (TPR) repeat protein
MAEARATYERVLAIDRAVGDVNSESDVLGNLAIHYSEQGRFDDARAHFERALALREEIGDRRRAALVLGNLAMLSVSEGHVALGRSQCEAALAIHRDHGERSEEGVRLMNLAGMDRSLGRFDEARRKFRRGSGDRTRSWQPPHRRRRPRVARWPRAR